MAGGGSEGGSSGGDGGGGSCSSSDGDKLTRGYSETSHIYAVKLASHPQLDRRVTAKIFSIEQ